ncbi:MAG: hypothetical protein IPL87_04770 [Candidatus Moraniibacteriota bacterium]|nr:MAG: hypothetical protein IPL87_04770 [Candidatus Moranbacteria bacterium]
MSQKISITVYALGEIPYGTRFLFVVKSRKNKYRIDGIETTDRQMSDYFQKCEFLGQNSGSELPAGMCTVLRERNWQVYFENEDSLVYLLSDEYQPDELPAFD